MKDRDGTVVVVGGGVIGLSVAFELLGRGRSVEVVARGDLPGVATKAAAGMLAPVSEAELEDPEILKLALDSLDRFPRFVADLEALSDRKCEFRTDGTLWVAVNRDDAAELDHLYRTLTDKVEGMPATWLTADEVLDREPHLSAHLDGRRADHPGHHGPLHGVVSDRLAGGRARVHRPGARSPRDRAPGGAARSRV